MDIKKAIKTNAKITVSHSCQGKSKMKNFIENKAERDEQTNLETNLHHI